MGKQNRDINSSEIMSEYLFKIVVIGDPGVGKTQMRYRFTQNVYNDNSKTTIGVDFATKLLVQNNGEMVKAQIWDTSGSERFRAITTQYYRGAVAALVVFDITRYLTFHNLDHWLDRIKEHVDNKNQVMIGIVGNKIDQEEHREVGRHEAERYAQQNNCTYFETSAKDSTGINDAFESGFFSLIKNCSVIGVRKMTH